MANIKPFQGCYYSKDHALADVVVSPDNFRATDSQHPQGFYRLDFSQDHHAVKQRLQEWFQAGHIQQDQQPCFYMDVQTFFYAGKSYVRQDLFVSIDVLNTPILPHEHTLPAVVKERHRLLDITQTHLSPLFLLYSDPEQKVSQFFNRLELEPFMHFAQSGVKHNVYRIADKAAQEHLQKLFQQPQLYLADGHHRYAAAVSYAEATGKGRYAMAYLTAIESEGMLVLPYHRHILPGFLFPNWPNYLKALSKHFVLEQLPDTHLSTLKQVLESSARCWIMQKQNKAWKISPRSQQQKTPLHLDVLHDQILEALAGFDTAKTRQGKCIHFSTDMAALQYALLTEGGVAFFVQPTPLTELCAQAEAHKMMPPKSTYFYPKVPSGILFNRFSAAVPTA